MIPIVTDYDVVFRGDFARDGLHTEDIFVIVELSGQWRGSADVH